MLYKIIVGLLLGFIGGASTNFIKDESSKSIVFGIVGLLSLGFIISSFMYGVVYGAMAITEVVAGFAVAVKLFD